LPLIAIACRAASQERWIYSEPVVYLEDHDPGSIKLHAAQPDV